jgi:hypothetical protein
MTRLVAIPLVLFCLVGTIDVRAQAIEMSYDTFMTLDDGQRLEIFPALPPANRAALLREQIARWRRVYADRLTPEQDQLLADAAAFIQPDQFEGRPQHSDEVKARFFALERRISNAFTTEEAYNLFTIHGPYLPPQ